MAGELSNFAEDGLLDHAILKAAFLFTPGGTRYLGISRADPGEDGSANDEPLGGEIPSYTRAAMVGGDWNAAAGRAITNSGDSDTWAGGGFPQLDGPITNATHWTLWTSPTGQTANEFLGRFPLPAPQTFPSGTTPIVEDGSLSAGWTAVNGLRTYAADKLLNHLMFKTEWDIGAESRYAYLSSTDPGVAGSPTEPTGGNYARVLVPGTTWGNTTGGANNNANSNIQFNKATADWLLGANLTHNGLADMPTGGNLIFADATTPAFAVLENGRVDYAVSAFAFTID